MTAPNGGDVTMDQQEWLAQRFEEHRPHLRAVAYRMFGSLSEADDAVQQAWLRLSLSDTSGAENLALARRSSRAWRSTCCARGRRGARSSSTCTCPTRRRPRPMGPIPSTRRFSPTPSAWRCSSCSRPSPRLNASRSSCTTCSRCPSTRSRRLSTGRPTPRGSSRAARAAAFAAPRPPLMLT